jgi:hypothetical protein
MEIIQVLINKTLLMGFVLSILVLVRHVFLFFRNMNDLEPKKYILTRKELIWVGLSFAYIITSLINGIKI